MSAEENSNFTNYQTTNPKDNIHSRLENAATEKGDSLVPLLLYGHLKSKGMMEEKYKTIAVTASYQKSSKLHEAPRDSSNDREWPPYQGIRFEKSLRSREVSKELG